jgi:predicted Zn-dependent protease
MPTSDARAAFVSEVGRHIVDSSDAGKPQSPYAGNFQFHLLRDPETINAFALPGGQIFITLGLYDKLEDEAQLAGVLGHEIGHVINRHASEHMAKGQLGGALATAVGVGASDDRGRGYGAAIAAQVANQMLQLKFSRGDESEADSYGLRYMTQAGYDPREMVGVMEILRDASKGGRTPEILATHPLPDTRLQEIAARIKQMFPDGIPSQLSKGRDLAQ